MSNPPIHPRYTTADFDEMGWHDCAVYAFSIDYPTIDFVMDLDYMLEWIYPPRPGLPFSHALSPATLVFHFAEDVRIEIRVANDPLLIDSITRTDPQPTPNGKHTEYKWIMECDNGFLSLRSIGFTQYLRAAPIIRDRQRLEMTERGGISFARTTFDGS